jgi:putative transposase
VQDGVGEGKRNEFHNGTCEGRMLGSDAFTDEILSMVDQKSEQEYSLSEVIATVCVHFHISEEMLKTVGKVRPMTEARAVAAAIVQTAPHLRLTDLAKVLGRDISALGKAAQRIAGDVNARRLVSKLVDAMQTDGSKCPKL